MKGGGSRQNRETEGLKTVSSDKEISLSEKIKI